jgi:hypothetical protein
LSLWWGRPPTGHSLADPPLRRLQLNTEIRRLAFRWQLTRSAVSLCVRPISTDAIQQAATVRR